MTSIADRAPRSWLDRWVAWWAPVFGIDRPVRSSTSGVWDRWIDD